MMNLRRYWGYLAFVLLITLWQTQDLGPGVLIAGSAVVTLDFLFQARLWCGAEGRGGLLCRNNSSGILKSCHLRQHKWEKLKMAFVSHRWRELNRGLWSSPRESPTTVATVLGIIPGIVGAFAAVFG